MLRRLQVCFVLGMCVVSIRAAAAEPEEKAAAAAADSDDEPEDKPAAAPEQKPALKEAPTPPPVAPPEVLEPPPSTEPEGWHTELHGYFRAPMALGLSSRPGPDNLNGPASTQISYGQNRTVDWSYYSFGYTRLQEQDWAEVFVHEKKKHVDAAVGWMGYWFAGVGYRNPDAAWAPAVAYVALDTDIGSAALKPNLKFTMGAWWPKFGYFEKYDTYTLGRFRQMGGQLDLNVPVNPDLAVELVAGFGTNRDGSWNSSVSGNPLYSTITAIDVLTYENAQIRYKKVLDASLHFNTMWTADPNLTQQTTPGKAYADVKRAHLSVIGAELNLHAPQVGHLWISPSYISVVDGWALANGGTEVMHSLGGSGISTNYLGWTNTPDNGAGACASPSPCSTGSGTMTNLGFMYENSLSSIHGQEPGSELPDVTMSVFGLISKSKLDLPTGSTFPQNTLSEAKYGVDATIQALDWLGVMLRYDLVNYDTAHAGYIFSAITSRLVFSSHFLSSERIYLQYSRYRYGDKMVLNGVWPWGSPLVAGANVAQAGPYSGQRPDYNVVKLQAEIAF